MNNMTPSPPVDYQSVAEAASALKKKYPNLQVVSATNSFVTVTYQRKANAHVQIKMTLTFPDGYNNSNNHTSTGQQQPHRGLVVRIDGGVNVAPGLKRKLEKELGEIVVKGSTIYYQQMDAVLQRFVEFIDTNLFVPCWKELRQVVELMNSGNDNNNKQQQPTRMNDAKGLIRLTFQNRKYEYKCSIMIDPAYPTTSEIQNYGKPCRLQVDSTNLPAPITTIITAQAQELVRRLQDGMSEDQARTMSNPVHVPLLQVDNNNNNKATMTPEEQWQREETGRLKLYGITGGPYDGRHPQPSLLPLVKFLRFVIHDQLMCAEEEMTCPVCHKHCLPEDPKELASMYKSNTAKSKRGRLVRVHCGHWYHFGCLDTIMNEPPFGIGSTCTSCSSSSRGEGNAVCATSMYHPDWPIDMASEREKQYRQRQAREREIADAASCF